MHDLNSDIFIFDMSTLTVGVLALQGAFIEHVLFLRQAIAELNSELSANIIEVRTAKQLETCNALVIPGGESTVMSLIAERTDMLEPLRQFVQDPAKPVWGTCAGLIFIGSKVVNGRKDQKLLNAMDIEVTRNAFGRQLDSKIVSLDFSSFIPGLTSFPATFIRAPVVSEVGENVEILSKLEDSGFVVAVKQGNKLGTSFHPELSESNAFHKYFLEQYVLKTYST